jgi:hypothetical protein
VNNKLREYSELCRTAKMNGGPRALLEKVLQHGAQHGYQHGYQHGWWDCLKSMLFGTQKKR